MMKPCTVDFLLQSLRQGDATSAHTFMLARLLCDRRMAVHLYCNDPVGPLPRDLRRLVKRIHPGDYVPTADVTVLQYPIWFPLAERIRQAAGKVIFWYHGVTPPALWGAEADRDVLERSLLGTELVWCAHQVIAASPFIAAELHKYTDYPVERIQIVPLGVPVEKFQRKPPTAVVDRLLRHWNLASKRVLLYTGRIAGNKRVDLLIIALARLKAWYPDVHLLVVGDMTANEAYRELGQRLRVLADDLGVAKSVTFTGRVPVIEPYYHLADVYVLASQHEGFGVTLVEAMAAGLPVVASASGSIPWVVGEGDEAAGLLFTPGSVDEMVTQIRRIWEDPGLRENLIARGAQRAEVFTQERFATRAWEIFSAPVESLLHTPWDGRLSDPLYRQADVAMRNYRVRSHIPFLGSLIEWLRYNLTVHVKEAYLDRIIERQVIYNRSLANELRRLRQEVVTLRAALEQERMGPSDS